MHTSDKFIYLSYIVLYMINKTTILVEKTTLKSLKDIKIAKRESYDEVINRLLNKEV